MSALETKSKEERNTRTLREGFLKLEMEISELEDLMKTKREVFFYGKEDIGGIGKNLKKKRLLFREKMVIRLAKEYDEQMDELAEIRGLHHALITSGAMATEFILGSLIRGTEGFPFSPKDKWYKRLNKALAESYRSSTNSIFAITMAIEKFRERNANLDANATAKMFSFWGDVLASLRKKHTSLLAEKKELSKKDEALDEVKKKLVKCLKRIDYAEEKVRIIKSEAKTV